MSYVPQDIRFTTRDDVLYAIAMGWDDSGQLNINSLATGAEHFKPIRGISLVGYDGDITWEATTEQLAIQIPKKQIGQHAFVYRIEFK